MKIKGIKGITIPYSKGEYHLHLYQLKKAIEKYVPIVDYCTPWMLLKIDISNYNNVTKKQLDNRVRQIKRWLIEWIEYNPIQ